MNQPSWTAKNGWTTTLPKTNSKKPPKMGLPKRKGWKDCLPTTNLINFNSVLLLFLSGRVITESREASSFQFAQQSDGSFPSELTSKFTDTIHIAVNRHTNGWTNWRGHRSVKPGRFVSKRRVEAYILWCPPLNTARKQRWMLNY